MTMTKPSASFCIVCVCARGGIYSAFFPQVGFVPVKTFPTPNTPIRHKKNKKTQERETFLYYFPCNSSQTSELPFFVGSHVTF